MKDGHVEKYIFFQILGIQPFVNPASLGCPPGLKRSHNFALAQVKLAISTTTRNAEEKEGLFTNEMDEFLKGHMKSPSISSQMTAIRYSLSIYLPICLLRARALNEQH